jgi:hypothetical protein
LNWGRTCERLEIKIRSFFLYKENGSIWEIAGMKTQTFITMKWTYFLQFGCLCGPSAFGFPGQTEEAGYQIEPLYGHNIGPVSGGLVVSSLPSSLASSFPEYDAPPTDKWEAVWVRSMKQGKTYDSELILASHPFNSHIYKFIQFTVSEGAQLNTLNLIHAQDLGLKLLFQCFVLDIK